MISRVWILAALAGAGCEEEPCRASWGLVTGDLDRAALAVWGSGADDVHVVGGGLGEPGRGALALHWDGSSWTELGTGRDETLWWVWGSGREDVWMVGEGGLVLRWDGRAFASVPSSTAATLYGVWGAAADDIWIVGGLPNGSTDADDDLVLHWDGAALARVPLPEARGVALFKVWGASADDVWIVGERGTIWRRRDGAWEDHAGDLATTTALFTVHGCGAGEVYAVGGQRVFTWRGEAWTEMADVTPWAGANGVACGQDGVLVVGLSGLKLRFDRAHGTWIDEQLVPPAAADFHGAWIDPAGGLWAVGGDFLSAPGSGRRSGAIAHHGCSHPAL